MAEAAARMSRQRFAILLIAAVVVISGALYLASERNLPRDVAGAPLLPGLGAGLGGIDTISVRKGATAPAVTLQKAGDRWTLAERDGYPADSAKVRKLLLSLGDAVVTEEKTADPANYAAIGVDDPAAAGASGTGIDLVSKEGGHSATHSIIIGKTSGDGVFARRAGEATSWLVRPAITAEASPRYWIDAALIDIPTASIQRIAVTPASGPSYAVHRVDSGKDQFALDAVPAGRQPLDPTSVGPSPIAFSGLTADDVEPAAGIEFKGPTTVLTLSNGAVVTLRGQVDGDKHRLAIEAPKDAALEAKAAKRVFDIAAYRYDAIFRPLEQLLEPKAQPKTGKAPAAEPRKPTAPSR
jgi:hypothetical protein